MWNSEMSTGMFLLNRSSNTHDTKRDHNHLIFIATIFTNFRGPMHGAQIGRCVSLNTVVRG